VVEATGSLLSTKQIMSMKISRKPSMPRTSKSTSGSRSWICHNAAGHALSWLLTPWHVRERN